MFHVLHTVLLIINILIECSYPFCLLRLMHAVLVIQMARDVLMKERAYILGRTVRYVGSQ
jgi:hypothetical protein